METPRERVQCKFFAHGACLKGEHCEFAHDWKSPSNNICTFYQRGACAYGSRCRYDHLKFDSTSSSSQPQPQPQPQPNPKPKPIPEFAHHSFSPPHATPIPAWDQQPSSALLQQPHHYDDNVSPEPPTTPLDPSDHPICSFAAAGHCPRGASCPHLHGDLCPTCGKLCLHPFRPLQREEHSRSCLKMHHHLDSLKRSQDIECSVCLERVLLKPKPKDRKFGLLSECDHPFCIACIRGWRSSSPSSGMDVNSTLRACPICRKLSYFVIPSVIWYFSKQEKDEILDSYKAKLKSIDCKHFDFGNGSCPFGTSCFYKHSYRDGTEEEVSLRHLGAADGQTVIAKNIRLLDFFDNLHIS